MDLGWFEHIIPCGIEGKGVTSISHQNGKNISVEDVVPLFLQAFSEKFECSFESKSYDDCFG